MMNTSFSNVFMYNNKIYNIVNYLEIEKTIFAIGTDYDMNYTYFKYKKVNDRYIFVPFMPLISILPQYQTVATKNIANFLESLTSILTKYPKQETTIFNKASEIINAESQNFKDKANLELTTEYFEARFINLLSFYDKKTISELLRTDSKTPKIEAKEIVKQTPRSTKKNTSKLAYLCLIIISFVGFLQCYSALSTWMSEGKKTDNIMNNLLASTEITEQEVDIEEIYNVADDSQTANLKKKNKYGADYWNYANVALMDVNFNELLKENKDTVGWLYVNNTNINYPFVQGNDNSYYLNRAFDKSKSAAGWLFADYRSDLTNFKRNTVIYGHGRVDQVMFGSLDKVLEKEWYTNPDNHIIKLSTPTQNTLWQVFAVYTIPAESYYLRHNFENDEDYLTFLNTIESRSKYDFNVNLDANDKILTLSTCLDYNGNRIVLHAKLVKAVAK